MPAYQPNVTPWQIKADDFPAGADFAERARFLLHYAVLAPSSHNSQPWKFAIDEERILAFVDPSRWLQVADADQRELHISVGCALENLVVAAEHFGMPMQIRYFPDPDNAQLVAAVEPDTEQNLSFQSLDELFAAIMQRQTNHNPFEANKPVSEAQLAALSTCCIEPDLTVHFFNDEAIVERVVELVVRADALQFADPDWRRELGQWIGQGAFGTSWLVSKMSQLAVTYLNLNKSTAKKDVEALQSAPVFGVLVTRDNQRQSQVQAGQLLQRLWLQATSLGLAIQPMNQVLQIPEVKAEFCEAIEITEDAPQIVFRLGYADRERKQSPRRPVERVLTPINVSRVI